ncbi:NAD(P)-binding protein [Annulohypoxylon maeteangense]|uniref:NAD(P)-binding protein n=1 Tax=Annulohypoxylon maeteangense TaxID=1927788 RepID=UPI0020074462|nr:NAD(P)-binding protein [Annulohypoxylon maeteangense]KAI0885302.1 NAD(P)-binding protein [Annulohypoxylon maeteangense]
MAFAIQKLLAQVYMKWFHIPLPPPDSFKDQSVLVTGGTAGLGLAAAVHFVNLGATDVIITSRDSARSQAAIATIERDTKGRSKGRVRVMDLDMSRYASVVTFAEEARKIRQGKGGIDTVVLNAGLSTIAPTLSEEGWDLNIQVNTLSTILLALLLLPWLRAERANRSAPAHLAVVGSGRHLEPNIQEWKKWTSETGPLEHFSKPDNWPGASTMYATTKLMAQYAVNELVKMALGSSGRPKVVVNTMCPGFVASDLSRDLKQLGIVVSLIVTIFTVIFGKSPSNGARTYVAACLTKESEHGRFLKFYGSDADYQETADTVITGEDGRDMQALVWSEMKTEFVAKVPEVREILKS